MKKKIVIYLIPSIVLIIMIALTVFLVSSPVFYGSYTYHETETDQLISIELSDQTFTAEYGSGIDNYEFGFYTYMTAEEYTQTTSGNESAYIIFRTVSPQSSTAAYRRANVFCFYQGSQIFICTDAIVLQIVYGIIGLGAIVVLVIFITHDVRKAFGKVVENNIDFEAFKFKLSKELITRGMEEKDLKYISTQSINRAMKEGFTAEEFADKFIPKLSTKTDENQAEKDGQ